MSKDKVSKMAGQSTDVDFWIIHFLVIKAIFHVNKEHAIFLQNEPENVGLAHKKSASFVILNFRS